MSTGVPVEPDYESQQGFRLYSYFFNPNTPNIASGVPVYVPNPGEIIWDAFIIVSEAFNGTTPKADVGFVATDDNVQTISESGPPTGGSFTAEINDVVSAVIPYNSTAAAIQTILQNMAGIGAGNVACSGGPLPGTPVIVTFQGALADADIPEMIINPASLVGGSASVSVSDTTGFFDSLSGGAAPVSLAAASAADGPALKAGTNLGNNRLWVQNPPPSEIPLELQLIMNETGAPGGVASGSTQGAATLYLAIIEAISINPTDPPLPL